MNYRNLCPHCMREIRERQGNVCPYCGYGFDQKKELMHQLRPFTILNGKYLVGDVLGEGGFGITYIGFDLNLEIRIALKEFYPNGFCSRESAVTNYVTSYRGANAETFEKWRQNFIREARRLAKCAHLPGIVGVKDFFRENNSAYIVMEYLEGITLKAYIRQNGGKIPAGQFLSSLEPVMISLAQVHRTGLIHRDISPDNIMLMADGSMKLLDFGAARDFTNESEKSLSVMLKPGYAPEEQYRTKGKQGPWSDVYALAATIYKCITGVTPPESMERMRQDELKKPRELGAEISPRIEAVLLKGMSVYAEQRFQSMEEFYQEMFAVSARPAAVQSEMAATNKQMPTGSGQSTTTSQSGNCHPKRNAVEVKGGSPATAKQKTQYILAAGLAVSLLFAVFLIILGRSDRKQETENTVVENVNAETAEARDTGKESELEYLINMEENNDALAANASSSKNEIAAGADLGQTADREVNTYQYEFLIDDVTWNEAYNDCIARGGHLVTIESQEEFEILTVQLTQQGYDNKIFWLGGMRQTGNSEYHWIDAEGNMDTVSLNRELEYQDYWLEGEPSYISEGEEEQYMTLFYRSGSGRWVWNDTPEDLIAILPDYYSGRVGYICEY